MKTKNKSGKQDRNTSKDIEKGITTDPFGSWTGVDAENIFEKPVQDVDDL